MSSSIETEMRDDKPMLFNSGMVTSAINEIKGEIKKLDECLNSLSHMIKVGLMSDLLAGQYVSDIEAKISGFNRSIDIIKRNIS